MPVTKRHIVIDSGSTSSAAGTCRVPTVIQAKRLTVTSRDEWCSKSTKLMTARTKLAATTPVADDADLLLAQVVPEQQHGEEAARAAGAGSG